MFLTVAVVVTLLSAASAETVVGNVAFTAGFSTSKEIAANQVVVYTDVILNEGGGYNSNTGVFTAPKGGIYVFQFYLLTQPSYDVWLHLYKNNDSIVSAYGHQNGDFASGGNSATLKLKKGDSVTIRTRRVMRSYGGLNEVYTTFTGYMIGPWNA